MSDFVLPVNVDLLSTPSGEPLLLADADLPAPVAAVFFDHETREVGLEFANGGGYVPCNVPVDDAHMGLIRTKGCAYIATLDQKNKLSTVSVLQLYHQSISDDDLYIPPFGGTRIPVEETQTVMGHVKRGQPLNRLNLTEGGGVSGLLYQRGITSPKTVGLSPRLQQELGAELELRRQMAPNFTPRMAPPGLGPRSSGTQLGTLNMQNMAPKPPSFGNNQGGGQTDGNGSSSSY